MENGYNTIQAAELLGVKPRTIREWLHNGKLKANKIPNSDRWIIMESEIKRMQGVVGDDEGTVD